jgi:small subunit ribosomal protein S15
MIELLSKFQKSPKDTGSSHVQVVRLTKRIQDLSQHMQKHRKDFHSRRGLMQCISQRKSLLAYIKRHSVQEYSELIAALGLRH